MRDDRVEYLLKEWGGYHEKTIDWANNWGANILYRAAFLAGKGGAPGHKILCPDMPARVRKIDTLVSRLPDEQKLAIRLQYATPLASEEKGKTVKIFAEYMDVSERKFKQLLTDARKCLRKNLLST
jgi:hypothetical protein